MKFVSIVFCTYTHTYTCVCVYIYIYIYVYAHRVAQKKCIHTYKDIDE